MVRLRTGKRVGQTKRDVTTVEKKKVKEYIRLKTDVIAVEKRKARGRVRS